MVLDLYCYESLDAPHAPQVATHVATAKRGRVTKKRDANRAVRRKRTASERCEFDEGCHNDCAGPRVFACEYNLPLYNAVPEPLCAETYDLYIARLFKEFAA